MRDGCLNFHKDGLGVLGGSGANHRPDGLGDAALLADDLAHILGRYVKLQNRRFRPDGLLNGHGVLVVHQRPRDVFDELFHEA